METGHNGIAHDTPAHETAHIERPHIDTMLGAVAAKYTARLAELDHVSFDDVELDAWAQSDFDLTA